MKKNMEFQKAYIKTLKIVLKKEVQCFNFIYYKL